MIVASLAATGNPTIAIGYIGSVSDVVTGWVYTRGDASAISQLEAPVRASGISSWLTAEIHDLMQSDPFSRIPKTVVDTNRIVR